MVDWALTSCGAPDCTQLAVSPIVGPTDVENMVSDETLRSTGCGNGEGRSRLRDVFVYGVKRKHVLKVRI